jgi:fucose 4-O-acetylase-like acetyltransferase
VRAIDSARGTGIILIALGHSWYSLGPRGLLFTLLFSFHVPLFFVLAGATLQPSRPTSEYLRTRADGLLKPYLFVLAAWGAMVFLGRWFAAGAEGGDPLVYAAGVLYGTGATVVWAPMWFLPCLFLSSLLARELVRHLEIRPAVLAGVATLLYLSGIAAIGSLGPHTIGFLGIEGSKAAIGWPWSLDLVPIGCAFMIAGYLARDWIRRPSMPGALWLAGLAALLVMILFFGQTMQLNERNVGNPVITTVQAVLGVATCIAGSGAVDARSPALAGAFAYVGQRSLFVLMFHSAIHDWIFHAMHALHPDPQLRSAAGLVAGIALPLLAWEVVAANSLLRPWLLPRRG